ncbi:reverse transcriptase domain-containing protein [Tanacetum coccineum]
MLKFPVDGGIVTIRSTILIPAECATVITSSKEIPKEAGVRHENFKVALHLNFPNQEVAIGGTLSVKERTELCLLLKEKLDIFAWQPSDMTGVPRSIAEHRLNIRELYSPIRQKKRGQAPERAKAIQTEMAESDEEKTAFHTSHAVYCYTKMPFSLKNADATYQRLVDKAFDNQVGRNIEVAVEGMFLGYMISSEGIKPCPDKTEVVLQLPKSLAAIKKFEECIKKRLTFIDIPDASKPSSQQKSTIVKATPASSTQTEGGTDCIPRSHENLPRTPSVVETPQEPWILFTDGSSCIDGSDDGLILTSREGTEFTYALRFQFTSSNNEAEYEALIAGLRITTRGGIRQCAAEGQKPGQRLANFSISQVPRSKKQKADALSKIALTRKGQIFYSLYGLFHEVDRGESRVDNHWKSSEEVRMGQHMKHPQSNGLVERANQSLGDGIKARLGEGNKNWIEELPHVLWAHRTTIKSSHGDTPFSLTYGTKAVIPAEIGMPTYRTTAVDAVHNDEELRLNLDLLEERRECAAIREAKAKSQMTKYYNARVRGVTFIPETLFTVVIMQAMLWPEGSLDQSGKDLMRSRRHSKTEHTYYGPWTTRSFHGRGT